MKIILASGSPRRRELLQQIGLSFEVVVSDCEEIITCVKPGDVVEELSLQKAKAVAKKVSFEEPVLIIGADTIVTCDEEILGKPKSEEDAFGMLKRLSGRTHEVFTGVSILQVENQNIKVLSSFHEATKVTFYEMFEQEIFEYIATKDCMDKAGSYGIQGFCARYIKEIAGDYNNVVGLPVAACYQKIKQYL